MLPLMAVSLVWRTTLYDYANKQYQCGINSLSMMAGMRERERICVVVLQCTSVPRPVFLVPKKLTLPSGFTKQCGVVPGVVDRWQHLVFLSLEIFVILKLSAFSSCEISIN